MSKKIYIFVIVMVATVIFATVCVFLILRGKDTTIIPEGSDNEGTELLSEETNTEKETIVVQTNDAADRLYDALRIMTTDPDNSRMDEALNALLKSANMGNSDAQCFLGEIYFQGIGTDIDLQKAGGYFRSACENGNKKAMKIYAKMLFMGEGVSQNYDESAAYLYTLSDSDGEAAYLLGVMSNLGIGVPQNAQNAEAFIDKSVRLGYKEADSYKNMIFDIGKVMDGTEEFVLRPKKICELQYETEYWELQQLIEQYWEILKETENYLAFTNEITALSDIDKIGISTITFFGNDGYLFHQNENDGTSLHDYIGDNHFSEDELKEIAQNLLKQKEWIESNGSKFVLLLIPNKECLYSESMPAYIKRMNAVTREDLLVEYLQKNTDINVVYVKDTLLKYKDTFPLFYKTDTHANMVGSLFMLSDLFSACYGTVIELDMSKFDIHMQDYMGDLGRMANCTKRYAHDKVYFYPKSSVTEEEKIASSVMLVGDSFSEFINIEMDYYLEGGVNHQMVMEYDYSYHSATQAGFQSQKPEYVVWECVERYLDRLR